MRERPEMKEPTGVIKVRLPRSVIGALDRMAEAHPDPDQERGARPDPLRAAPAICARARAPGSMTEFITLELPAELLSQLDRAVRRRSQAIRNEPAHRQPVTLLASELAQMTGLTVQEVNAAVAELERRRLLTRQPNRAGSIPRFVPGIV
jgi:hypothetical protein